MTYEEARQAEAAYRVEWEATHTAEEIVERDRLEQVSRDSMARHMQDPEWVATTRAKPSSTASTPRASRTPRTRP